MMGWGIGRRGCLSLFVVPLVLVAAAMAAEKGSPGSATSHVSEQQLEGMALRLHDLPRGFVVGDDSGCGWPGTEGAMPQVESWALKYMPERCEFQYERLFAIPGPGVVPPLVESGVLDAHSEEGVKAGLGLAAQLTQEQTGDRSLPAEVPAPEIGGEARLFHGHTIGGKGSILYWRNGNLLASILVAGGAPLANDWAVTRLAALQQKHIESPTPYTEAERDDSFVPLDNPHLKMPVYWLGRKFAPGGGLPPSTLASAAVALRGEVGPPGEKIELQYDLGPRIGTWTKVGWKKRQRTLFTRINWTRSCSPPTRTELDGGSAIVFGVHLSREGVFPGKFPKSPAPCPGKKPNHYFAIIHKGGVVLGIGLTICYACAEPHAGPYDSLRGMKAIVRGLQLRPAAG
jgi:hypothetical protein